MFPRDIKAKDFIEHTEPAVKALIDAIAVEKARYTPLLDAFENAHKMHFMDFTTADLNEDFNECLVQHKFAQAAEAKMQALLISQSIEVLCGAVLQIAKQGISLILEGNDMYSRGRMIGSQHLSNVIWHGRNQSMHWELGTLTHDYTKKCFKTLTKDFGKQFDFGESPRNLAWDLWEIIRWSSYEDYEGDIREMLEI